MSSQYLPSYDVVPATEVRYRTLETGEAQTPQRLAGDPLNGFYMTSLPHRVGWWNTVLHEKQILASLQESGNLATAFGNYVLAPLIPGEQRYVKLGSFMLAQENLGQDFKGSIGEYLSGQIQPVMNAAGIDTLLKWEDPEFKQEAWTAKWLSTNPLKNTWLAERGYDMEKILSNATNKNQWVYLMNRTMLHAQASDEIEAYKAQANWFSEGANMFASGVINYGLTDPTLLPSLALPLGGALGVAKPMAPAARYYGTALVRGLGASPKTGALVGRNISRVFRVPAHIQAKFIGEVGYKGALATEMGAYTGVLDTVWQHERMKQAEIDYSGNDDYVQDFSWTELGLATGIGAGLGFMIGGKLGRDADKARKAWVDQFGGSSHNPLYYKWDYLQADHRLTSVKVRAQRMSQELLGEIEHHAVAKFFRPDQLERAGVDEQQLLDVLKTLHTAANGKQLRMGTVVGAMQEVLSQGQKVNDAMGYVDDALENLWERQAWQQAKGRAAQELGDEASNLMDDEITKLENQVLNRSEVRKYRIVNDDGRFAARSVQAFDDEGKQITEVMIDMDGRDVLKVVVKPSRGRGAAHIDVETVRAPGATHGWDSPISRREWMQISGVMAEHLGLDNSTKWWVGSFNKGKGQYRMFPVVRFQEEAQTALGQNFGHVVDPRTGDIILRANQQAGRQQYWVNELTILRNTAELRDLTPDEHIYLGKVMRRLESFNESRMAAKRELTEVEDLVKSLGRPLSKEEQGAIDDLRRFANSDDIPNPLKGMKDRRGDFYREGRMAQPLRLVKTNKLATLLAKINQEEQLVAKTTDKRLLKNARARLNRARKNLVKLDEEAGKAADELDQEKLMRKVLKAAEDGEDPRVKSTRGRREIMAEALKAIDSNAAELMEDATHHGRLLTSWGLGKLIRIGAMSGSGQDETIRSFNAAIREIASEFENNKTRLEDLLPNSEKSHLTMETLKQQLDQRFGRLNEAYHEIANESKKWGSQLTPAYYRKRREFDKALIQHINGKHSDDADVVKLANLWKEMIADVEEVGAKYDWIDPTDNFFPRRFNIGKLFRDRANAEQKLAKFFLREWQNSDAVHLDTLVEAGLIKRTLDEGTLNEVYVKVSDGEIVKLNKLKRSSLEAEFGISETAYDKMLVTANDQGHTPMGLAAIDAISSLTGSAKYQRSPVSGKILKSRGGRARSQFERQLPNKIMFDEEIAEYMDFRFMDLAHDYMQSTGFSILNNARHGERWHIPGLTMRESLDELEAMGNNMIRQFSEDDLVKAGLERGVAQRKFRAGVRSLRTKLDIMEGKRATLKEETNAFREWISQMAEGAAGMMWGGGIGQTIITTEALFAMMSRVFNPFTDLVKHMFYAFKYGAAALMDGETKARALRTFGLAARQNRIYSMERLTGGAVTSSYQYGIVPRLVAPWKEAWDVIVGGMHQHGGNVLGRGAAAPIALLRAGMSNAMQIGGLEYWTTFGRLMHIQTQADEAGRFFKAAESAAELLKINGTRLDNINTGAYDKAIKAGKTHAAARAQARKEVHKAWRGVIRQAGYGKNWQVAEKWARHRLLDGEKLRVLRMAAEETDSLVEGSFHKTMDFTTLAEWAGGTADERTIFAEALRDLSAMVEQTIHKRISEQNISQRLITMDSNTALGRMMHVMTGWARSAYDNILLDSSQMPLLPAAGMVGTFMFGETLGKMVRSMFRGQDFDDIYDEFQEDPVHWVARSMTNFPVMGMFTPTIQWGVDAALKDGHRTQGSAFGGAGLSAFDNFAEIIAEGVHTTSPMTDSDNTYGIQAQRYAARLIPGYRSWWFLLGAYGLDKATGYNIGKELEKPRVPTGRVRYEGPDYSRTVPDPTAGQYDEMAWPRAEELPNYFREPED
jgi:hypothetical protein